MDQDSVLIRIRHTCFSIINLMAVINQVTFIYVALLYYTVEFSGKINKNKIYKNIFKQKFLRFFFGGLRPF